MNKISFHLRNVCGIYCLFNLKNGKKYIGSSINIYNRIHEHVHLLKRNQAHNLHLQNAWNKYGEDSFEFSVLEFCNSDVRFTREQWYISNLKPEYNLTENVVANYGHRVSDITKQKISNTLKKRYALGEIHTYRQDHALIPCVIFDIDSYQRIGDYKCIRDACRSIGSKDHKADMLYKKKYVILKLTTLCGIKESLKDFLNRNFKLATSENYKYIITEDPEGGLQYHFTLKDAAKVVNCNTTTLSRHLNATKECPYVTQSGYKMYISNTYYSIDAVQKEESSELLSGNIGRTPEMDNTEINSETKESESSYSVESEPDKNIISPRVSDTQNG